MSTGSPVLASAAAATAAESTQSAGSERSAPLKTSTMSSVFWTASDEAPFFGRRDAYRLSVMSASYASGSRARAF